MSDKTAALNRLKTWVVSFVLALCIGAVSGGYEAAKEYIAENPVPIEAVVGGLLGTTVLGYFVGRKNTGKGDSEGEE